MKGRIKTITRGGASKYKNKFIFDYDWNIVKEVFKNEDFYLRELFKDVLNSLKLDDKPISYKWGLNKNEVNLYFGLSPTNKEFSFKERAIQHIKLSFLKHLESLRLIKDLNMEERLYLNTEDNNEYPYFSEVNFLCYIRKN